MNENECIGSFFLRMDEVVNKMEGLGYEIFDAKIVQKVL